MLYSKVDGRRATDSPGQVQWKFDWWKLVMGGLITALLGWGTWVTINCFKAEAAEEKINLQTTVLHTRIEAVEQRHVVDDQKIRQWLLDKILELQKEIHTGKKSE